MIKAHGVVAALALTLVTFEAQAQEGGDKKRLEDVEAPDALKDAAADAKASVAEEPKGKAGPILLDLGLGPSFNLSSSDISLAIQTNIGFAVVKGDGDGIGGGDLYVLLAPSLAIGSYLELTVPVGLQYDIPLPVENLYVYPRATVGYLAVLNPGNGASGDGLAVTPAAGVKMQASDSFHIGLDPIQLPIIIGNGSSVVEYRAMAYAGFDL